MKAHNMTSKTFKMLTLTALLLTALSMTLSACDGNDSVARASSALIREGGSNDGQSWRDWRPNFDELEWFETAEEAVYHNKLPENHSLQTVDEHIAIFKGEERITFFFRTQNMTGNDVVMFYTGWLKREGDKVYYSPFMGGSGVSQNSLNSEARLFGLDEIGEIRYSISMLGNASQIQATDDNKTFVWGLSQTPRIHTLQIERQSPTNIIPIQLDGETAYFWYFEDLQTDKPLGFQDLTQYTEGELIITMDD